MDIKQRVKETRSEIRYYLKYGKMKENTQHISVVSLTRHRTAIRLRRFNNLTICIIDNNRPNIRIWYKTIYKDIFRDFAVKNKLRKVRLSGQPRRRHYRDYSEVPTWCGGQPTIPQGININQLINNIPF